MADKRMFSKSVIESDAFTSMPLSTQGLYFHLAMRADNDGFVDNPKTIIRIIGANEDDLNILIAKRYILTFPSGVIVIKHWWINNWYDKKKYKPTNYQEERDMLIIKDNKSYTEKKNGIKGIEIEELSNKNQTTGVRQESDSSTPVQYDSTTPVQNRIGENRLEENRVVAVESAEQQPSNQEVYDTLQQIFPNCSTSWVTAIELYKPKLSNSLIIYAIKETASSGSNSPKYFKSICDRYILNGFKSVSDIKPDVKNARGSPKKTLTREEYNAWFENKFLKVKS